jgi:hypothetical protein
MDTSAFSKAVKDILNGTQEKKVASPVAEDRADPTPEKPVAVKKSAPVSLDLKPTSKLADAAIEAATADDKSSDKDYNWNRVKSERDAAQSKLAEMEKMVADFKAKLESTPREYEAKLFEAAKARDELSSRLEQVAIERHPKFDQQFIQPINRLAERMKQIAPAEIADKLAKIVLRDGGTSSTEEVDAMVSDLPTATQTRIFTAMNSAAELHESKLAALNRSREQYQALVEEQRKQQEGMIEGAKGEFENVFAEARANLEMFQARDGDAEWNESVSQREAMARNIYMGQVPPKDAAKAAMWAATAPAYREALHQQLEVNRRLTAQLKALQGTTPRIDGGGASAKKDEAGLDFVSHVKKLMRGDS